MTSLAVSGTSWYKQPFITVVAVRKAEYRTATAVLWNQMLATKTTDRLNGVALSADLGVKFRCLKWSTLTTMQHFVGNRGKDNSVDIEMNTD